MLHQLRIRAVILALWLAAFPGLAFATEFHDNPWVFVASTHTFNHTLLSEMYDTAPTDYQLFYPFMASNSYPGALSGPQLGCLSPKKDDASQLVVRPEFEDPPAYSLSASLVDELLDRLDRHATWMVTGNQSYRPVYTYATGPRYHFSYLPILGHSLEAAGDRVNYVGCDPALDFMAVNAQHSEHGSNFMTLGTRLGQVADKPLLLDQLPMHELVHIHQNNYAPYKLASIDESKISIAWLIEGTADAVAIHRVHTLHGGHRSVMGKAGPYSNSFYRRFYLLRNYNLPLNFEPSNSNIRSVADATSAATALDGVSEKMWSMFGYETNGFWFHVLERYLNGSGGKFTDLWTRLDPIGATEVTRRVDDFLDAHDGNTLKGLEHVYPQFLAEFTNWWDSRNRRKISENKWMKTAYNGCVQFDLSRTITSETKEFDISPYAGKCVDIRVTASAGFLLNDLQLAIAGADKLADEIYVGVSRISGTPRGTQTCFDVVEARGIATAPCLIDPQQGFANWKTRGISAQNTLLRTFNITDIRSQLGQELFVRLVVVRSPSSHYDLVGKLKRKTLSLTVSLDLLSLESKSESSTANKKRAVMKYGRRQGEGPVSPEGNLSVFEASLEDALRGRVLSSGVPQAPSGTMNQALNFELIDDEGTNFGVGLLLLEPLTQGVTGEVDVIGILGEKKMDGSQVVSYQDPDRESTLTILEHDQGTMRLKGQVNVCAAPLSALMGDDPDLCSVGERLSYDVEGAIAFPSLLRDSSGYQLYSTQAYEDYKDLRIARLGLGPGGTPTGMGGGTRPGNGGASGAGASSGSAGSAGGSASCSVRDSNGACDCSCAGKACLESLKAAGALSRQDNSCRLTCGKRWMECAP